MKRTTVNLRVQAGYTVSDVKFIPWPAYETSTPGLVAHKARTGSGNVGDWWIITHALSGYGIGTTGFDTRKEALAAAVRLGEIADWTKPVEDIAAALFGNGDKIRAALYPGQSR